MLSIKLLINQTLIDQIRITVVQQKIFRGPHILHYFCFFAFKHLTHEVLI